MAGHCRRYANLRPDKTGDCKVEYGVCLSAATGGIFGEVGVTWSVRNLKKSSLSYLNARKIESETKDTANRLFIQNFFIVVINT
jgi:hypothetical protein